MIETSNTLVETLEKLCFLFPKTESNFTIRNEIKKIPSLQKFPLPEEIAQFLVKLEELFSRLS
jgi:hypothetical protein